MPGSPRRDHPRPATRLLAGITLLAALAVPAGAAQAAHTDTTDGPRWDPGAEPWERVPRDRVAEECGMDPALLERADTLLAPKAYTVVRYGKLCWEANHTEEAYHVASITKTMGALMVGLTASRSGLDEEDRLDEWVDLSAWPLVNPDATVAHALSMSAFNPSLAYPTKRWMYDTLGDREIDALMEAVDAAIAAEPAAFPGISDRVELVQEALLDPLGMAGTDWQGETIGFSMNSTPRDLARLGLLIARGGVYGGEQLIDPGYIYRMTHPVFEDANTGYGYLTYLNADAGWTYSTGTNDLVCSPVAVWDEYPHEPFEEADNDHGGAATRGERRYDVGAVWASGAGGQRITVHRGLDLVMTIRDESTNEGHKSVWNAIRPALVAEDPTYAGDEVAFCADYRDAAYAPDLLPELAVAPPAVVEQDGSLALAASVSNVGEQDARDVAVRFLVDGAAVAPDLVVEELAAGEATDVTVPWNPPAGTATHAIQVAVDPDEEIRELGTASNEANLAWSSDGAAPADGAPGGDGSAGALPATGGGAASTAALLLLAAGTAGRALTPARARRRRGRR